MALVKEIVFVDGENLVMRYQDMLRAGRVPRSKVVHMRDRFVWIADPRAWRTGQTDILRINYYTSAVGADDELVALRKAISDQRSWSQGDYYGECQLVPRVFKKEAQSHKSRLVDINIAIDAMRHATSAAIEVVHVISGDGDFIALLQEIARHGVRTTASAFSSGLSPQLPYSVDRFALLDDVFFMTSDELAAKAAAEKAEAEAKAAAQSAGTAPAQAIAGNQ